MAPTSSKYAQFRKAIITWQQDLHALNTGYELCLWQEGVTIEKDKIYLQTTQNGSLQYHVNDPYGHLKIGLISKERVALFGDRVINKMTDDDLKLAKLFLYDILNKTAEKGHTRAVTPIAYVNKLFDDRSRNLVSVCSYLPDSAINEHEYLIFSKTIIQVAINVSTILINALDSSTGLTLYFFNPLNVFQTNNMSYCNDFLKRNFSKNIPDPKTYDLAAIFIKYMTHAMQDNDLRSLIQTANASALKPDIDLIRDRDILDKGMKQFQDEKQVYEAHCSKAVALRKKYLTQINEWELLFDALKKLNDVDVLLNNKSDYITKVNELLLTFNPLNKTLKTSISTYPSKILDSSAYLDHLEKKPTHNSEQLDRWHQEALKIWNQGSLKLVWITNTHEVLDSKFELGAKLIQSASNRVSDLAGVARTSVVVEDTEYNEPLSDQKLNKMNTRYDELIIRFDGSQDLDEKRELILDIDKQLAKDTKLFNTAQDSEKNPVQQFNLIQFEATKKRQVELKNKQIELQSGIETTELIARYFTADPSNLEALGESEGVFNDYLKERHITYFWYDWLQSWASFFLCSYFKSDRTEREDYIRSLTEAAVNYQSDSNKLTELENLLQMGRREEGILWKSYHFYPRPAENENDVFNDKSLQFKLREFKRDLNKVEDNRKKLLGSVDNSNFQVPQTRVC